SAAPTRETCSKGQRTGGPPPNGNDNNPCTDDTCDTTLGCVHTPNTASCTDNNACTAGDHCVGGTCVSGSPVNCDDGDICTTDACNPSTGCTHTSICACKVTGGGQVATAIGGKGTFGFNARTVT